MLDEYCRTTLQNRKYVIRKIRTGKYIKDKTRTVKRKKENYYDGCLKAALIKCWKIFDHPCGQRLEPLLKTEVEGLRKFGELKCSNEEVQKLKEISSSSIDRKLKHQKEVEHLKRKYHHKIHPLLYQKIPVKISDEQDRTEIGNIQTDLVEHCGQSAQGEYLNTLSSTDISTGWWEGEAIMGKPQERTFEGLKTQRERFPFSWREIHSDNGTEFINWHFYRYTQKEHLDFSRSRPNKKNDNCFVEQKNWTHVKKFVGYFRYDAKQEQDILQGLYRNELRLCKNFFQPVIKLKSKERISGKIHRRYDTPETPYQRVIESKGASKEKKQKLRKIYISLNPAELKREIDKKLNLLYQVYQKKNRTQKRSPAPSFALVRGVESKKKLKPNTVTFLTQKSEPISVT